MSTKVLVPTAAAAIFGLAALAGMSGEAKAGFYVGFGGYGYGYARPYFYGYGYHRPYGYGYYQPYYYRPYYDYYPPYGYGYGNGYYPRYGYNYYGFRDRRVPR